MESMPWCGKYEKNTSLSAYVILKILCKTCHMVAVSVLSVTKTRLANPMQSSWERAVTGLVANLFPHLKFLIQLAHPLQELHFRRSLANERTRHSAID